MIKSSYHSPRVRIHDNHWHKLHIFKPKQAKSAHLVGCQLSSVQVAMGSCRALVRDIPACIRAQIVSTSGYVCVSWACISSYAFLRGCTALYYCTRHSNLVWQIRLKSLTSYLLIIRTILGRCSCISSPCIQIDEKNPGLGAWSPLQEIASAKNKESTR